MLWELMTAFYTTHGVQAWCQEIVPYFVTSNAFVARVYAQLVEAFWHDLQRLGVDALAHDQPLYVVEAASGSGKLGFLLAKALHSMRRSLPVPLQRVTVVLSDVVESNVRFWEQHPTLRRLVRRGLVDFAVFDACRDTELRLRTSGVRACACARATPSLRDRHVADCAARWQRAQPHRGAVQLSDGHAAARLLPSTTRARAPLPATQRSRRRRAQVRDGQLLEGRIALFSSEAAESCADASVLDRMRSDFEFVPTTADYYSVRVAACVARCAAQTAQTALTPRRLRCAQEEEEGEDAVRLNGVLAWYQRAFRSQDATFRCVQRRRRACSVA